MTMIFVSFIKQLSCQVWISPSVVGRFTNNTTTFCKHFTLTTMFEAGNHTCNILRNSLCFHSCIYFRSRLTGVPTVLGSSRGLVQKKKKTRKSDNIQFTNTYDVRQPLRFSFNFVHAILICYR